MNNWITALFNMRRRQTLLNMFGRRRNNNGIMWASVLGLGISAAVYGLTRNQNGKMQNPGQYLTNIFPMGKNAQRLNMAGLTEFAKELIPNKNPFTNK
ncbi:hypothetical protein V7150_19775 [Neobacillus drentensis]|uniref:hypothetical protein n=1 Tax=Neobacillus drentensis TaxID=220684 RepID=UPI002FFDFAC6